MVELKTKIQECLPHGSMLIIIKMCEPQNILLKHLLHIIWLKMKRRELKWVVKIINLWIDSKVLKENSWDFLNIEGESRWVVFNSLQPHELYSPWNSLGQNTGVGSLSLLQGSNPGLPHCRQILYQLSYKNYNFNSSNNKLNLKISKGLEKTFFPNIIYKWQTNIWKYS